MQKERYPYKANKTFTSFEFQSKGPNGTIKKIVDYVEIGKWKDDIPVYNLAFGDLDESNQIINDLSISNNFDRDKILATVAITVKDVIDYYGEIAIHAEGSTASRTRLYQMGINANHEEIKEYFDIYGLKNFNWREFEPGTNYEAFMVTKKNLYLN
ncbi:hypothetical protein [Chitinophaga sp.]|uniref:DUF6934 family protein n=1 Tax=Chitinophaga sp. TaxID=1869181 RepID=UPI0031E0C691